MRICVLSERLTWPFDEGIKNYALRLAHELAQKHDVLTLTAFAPSIPDLAIESVPTNRLFLSAQLAARLGKFRPELIIYVPTACATLFSFLRTRMLKLYGGGAPVVMVALQARSYGPLARALMPMLRPDLVLVQSETTCASLAALGCAVRVLSPAIDLDRFKPASAQQRAEIRRKYEIAPDTYVVLHVGHLKRKRNVQALLSLQERLGVQAMVVGSTSTPHDEELVTELVRAGVRVTTQFVANIAEIYQVADCYIFPVREETGAIDLPLSVLEAMACDLPIVTTRFGGLPTTFKDAPGVHYADSDEEMIAAVAACRRAACGGTRALVEPYAWPKVAEQVLAMIEGALQ